MGVAVLSLAGVAVSHGAESAAPLKLRFGGDPTQTRVVLELDRPARAEVVSDGAADGHVVLSFSQLTVGDDLDGKGKGIVTAWSLEKGLNQAQPGVGAPGPHQTPLPAAPRRRRGQLSLRHGHRSRRR
jgi:N-acetylmuramoyl-L-alanine amidase